MSLGSTLTRAEGKVVGRKAQNLKDCGYCAFRTCCGPNNTFCCSVHGLSCDISNACNAAGSC
ncbi:MAG: hypothetical protein QM528_08390 [Phycisphaerales bacterium]|nr:hypothetical protein [Phycisphaerales bacterium]